MIDWSNFKGRRNVLESGSCKWASCLGRGTTRQILNFGQASVVVIRVRGDGALYGIVPLYGKIKTRALLSCFDKRGKGLAKLNTLSVSLICRCACKIIKCCSTTVK